MNNNTMATTSTTTTLRDVIMEIQLKYVKDTPLFRSVDLAYNSEEYVFAYHQSMADALFFAFSDVFFLVTTSSSDTIFKYNSTSE